MFSDHKEAAALMDGMQYESDEQRDAMEEPITLENCGQKLRLLRDVSGISRRELAQIIGTSETTISRLETKKTTPTQEFMNRLRALVVIGFYKFKDMSEAEKETLSEAVGAAGGVVAGVGGAFAAVSASGAVAGLSVTGITSGLAALGGSMLGGLAVVAVIPVAVGLGGYGLVKGIKAICDANRLSCTDIDGRYEIKPEEPEEVAGDSPAADRPV
jgi:DNA-binding XRE family transcriptional regulator